VEEQGYSGIYPSTFVFQQCGKLLPEVAKSVIVVDESSALLMPSELSKELSNTTLAGICGRMLCNGEETRMTKIMLVRHGETDWNREEVFRGRIDVGLNQNGREQAGALAEATRIFQIDAIYSSPLSRSLETAKIADGFIDLHYGGWQGLEHGKVKERYPDLYLRWQVSPHLVKFPGGESLEDVRERAIKELRTIVTDHENQTVMIVSHRVVSKVILCSIIGLDNSHFWRIRQDNCCLNIFECSEDAYIICLLNDICHLKQTTGSTLKADF
jgi:broad specificity phosphatase PhoE